MAMSQSSLFTRASAEHTHSLSQKNPFALPLHPSRAHLEVKKVAVIETDAKYLNLMIPQNLHVKIL